MPYSDREFDPPGQVAVGGTDNGYCLLDIDIAGRDASVTKSDQHFIVQNLFGQRVQGLVFLLKVVVGHDERCAASLWATRIAGYPFT